ncbi:OmpA family protein [Corallococcus sp. H22C18031201]|uniref:OmpA family protein n=1 Tax=Citreicoccus inhibens TaxID=2849499 RepID=UPI000E70BAF6|nr:OmpA family protein [Citreicoccus inhibens]MBU8900698.1 thrombospondin type 3 repeat-containing protein [Citreicoccus inhibens]RJS14507.1 OmpA family protein [Corallococcus sp. H22C18031201]
MRLRTSLRRAAALALALTSTAALAQISSTLRTFELERLDLNPGAEGSLLLGLGELMPPGTFRGSVALHYAHSPLQLEQDGQTFQIVSGRATLHVAAAYAPTRWLQVGLQLPLVAFQMTGSQADSGFEQPSHVGLGTPGVSLRVGLLTQDDAGGVDMAAELGAGLPVGSEAVLARDPGGWRLSPRLMVGRHFGFIRAGLEVGFLQRPSIAITRQLGASADQIGNELRVGAALATTGRRLRWELNVRGMVPLTNQPGAAELLPGFRYLVNPSFELFGLVGMGVGSAPGTPLFRMMMGGAFGGVTPRRGPGESSVNCEPGLVHTLEECPEMDEDGDGVRNGVDRCPTEPGSVERKGCSAKDTDGDGIEDMLDACPVEPGPAARQGCPVQDQDKDDVPDEVDSCPTAPGPADNRGCPVRDNDKDGIDNDKDACPNEAGPPERDGCPETDTDKDGVPNRADSCANEAGTVENLGCPQHVQPLVELKRDRLVLQGKVFFDAAGVRIQPRSFELLDWVARVILEHPEMPLIVVGGHTDDRGFPDANRRMSQGRAEAVRQYLIQKKVPAERLQSQGYGQDRPIDSNATSIGRENNRRVDFVIVDPELEKAGAPRR